MLFAIKLTACIAIDACYSLWDPFQITSIHTTVKDLVFPGLAGVLRLSTKYSIAALRRKAIEILQRLIPTKTLGIMILSRGYQSDPEFLFALVNLARETNVPILLPSLLVYCMELDTKCLFRGQGGWKLTPADLELCILGRETCLEAQAVQIVLELPPRDWRCGTGPCTYDELSVISIYGSRGSLSEMTKPLSWRSGPSKLKVTLCGVCQKQFEKGFHRGLVKLWKSLPSLLGLGSWEDIEKIQNM